MRKFFSFLLLTTFLLPGIESAKASVSVQDLKVSSVDAYWNPNKKQVDINLRLPIGEPAYKNLLATELKGFNLKIFDVTGLDTLPTTPLSSVVIQTSRKPDSQGLIFASSTSSTESFTWTGPKAGREYVISANIETTAGSSPVSQSGRVKIPDDFVVDIQPTKSNPNSFQNWQLFYGSDPYKAFASCTEGIGDGCTKSIKLGDSAAVAQARFLIGRTHYFNLNCFNGGSQPCQIDGYPSQIRFEVNPDNKGWKVLSTLVADNDSNGFDFELACAARPELCTGSATAARLISQNGVFANFVINFGSTANPVGQSCKTVGQTVGFAPLRENYQTTYTRKAVCTKTAKGLRYVEKAVPSLPYCTGLQLASLTNFKRQETAISNLLSFYQTAYQKAELSYQNAMVLGNSYNANIAKIDMESAKSQINKYSAQQQDVSRQSTALLSKCRVKDPNAQGATGGSSTSVKKVACTSGEKSQLRLLASQYSTAQNLVRIDDETYGKFKELRSAAAASGNNTVAAQYQVELGKLNIRIQQDRTSANLIKTEFSQINSGCLNSGVSIESEYRIKYYP
jgi:hypothetical protein